MLDIAIKAAKVGARVGSNYFKNTPKVTYKGDNSPVTKADIEAEKAIRKVLSKAFPDHGIIGEELPEVKAKSEFKWIIDPIDGTRDYIRRIPHWATYVALLKKDEPILSVVLMPISNDLATAQIGKGAFLNGKKASVSKTKNLKNAYISFGQIKRFVADKKEKNLEKLCTKASASRGYGNLGFKLMLEGKLDIVLESYGQLYDFAPTALLIKEAGGKFSDFNGVYSLTNKSGVWTNGLLHKQVIDILK